MDVLGIKQLVGKPEKLNYEKWSNINIKNPSIICNNLENKYLKYVQFKNYMKI